MNCETLGRHHECKANFNFEHCHTTKPQRKTIRTKFIKTQRLQELYPNIFTSSPMQFHQWTANWQVKLHQDLWTLNSEQGNIEQGTMHHERYHFSGWWTAMDRFATCNMSNMSKKTSTSSNELRNAGRHHECKANFNFEHFHFNQFEHFHFSNLHLKDAPFKLLLCRFSRKHVRKPCSSKEKVEQCTGNSAQVQSVHWTTAHSVQLMPIAMSVPNSQKIDWLSEICPHCLNGPAKCWPRSFCSAPSCCHIVPPNAEEMAHQSPLPSLPPCRSCGQATHRNWKPHGAKTLPSERYCCTNHDREQRTVSLGAWSNCSKLQVFGGKDTVAMLSCIGPLRRWLCTAHSCWSGSTTVGSNKWACHGTALEDAHATGKPTPSSLQGSSSCLGWAPGR